MLIAGHTTLLDIQPDFGLQSFYTEPVSPDPVHQCHSGFATATDDIIGIWQGPKLRLSMAIDVF